MHVGIPGSLIMFFLLFSGHARIYGGCELCPAFSKPILAKRRNKARQKLRTSEPTDLQFTLDEDYIPASFMRADIQVQSHRHIVLASDNMVILLQRAKTWYIDATFKVMKDPFSQLFTVQHS